MGYARRICELRQKRGWTQAELAHRSGIPQANLSNIERGRQDVTVSTLLRICQALGVSPAEVFQKEPARTPLRWSRKALERVARAVVGSSQELEEEEGEIVKLLKDLVPGQGPRLSTKQVYESWYALKQRLSDEAIKTLVERVRDARERLLAEEKRADR